MPDDAQSGTPDPVQWPVPAATGVGSMPGTDAREAVRVVLGELPELPHLPELPARGAGADLIGRTLGLLPDFAATTVPSGWRITSGRGADLRRASSWLAEDLDHVEDLAAGFTGLFKLQLAGPLTMAAGIELAGGERMLRDHGARRELTEALAEAVASHLVDVARRLPGARLLLQFDEPALPAVLAGQVPTAAGRQNLPAVPAAEARDLLTTVLSTARANSAGTAVHCCAARVPIGLLTEAGVDAVSVDAELLSAEQDEALGVAVESGTRLLLGLVPTDSSRPGAAGPGKLTDPAATVAPVIRLWHRIGLTSESLATAVLPTPACGMAGADPLGARSALELARRSATLLLDPPEVRA